MSMAVKEEMEFIFKDEVHYLFRHEFALKKSSCRADLIHSRGTNGLTIPKEDQVIDMIAVQPLEAEPNAKRGRKSCKNWLLKKICSFQNFSFC